MSPSSAGANMSVAFWFANTGGLRRLTAQGRSGLGQVRISCIAGRLELDRTHIHRGSVVKSWPKFCKVRDCGVCRARRSRGGLFPLAYSPSKAIGRNSQRSGIPTEILKIRVFGQFCVRASVYASVIRSAPQKSPPRFWILLHQPIFPGSSSHGPLRKASHSSHNTTHRGWRRRARDERDGAGARRARDAVVDRLGCRRSGIPTEILKIRVFGQFCVRASVYASVIRSAPQKSPPRFWILLHQAIFPGSSSHGPLRKASQDATWLVPVCSLASAPAALCPPGQNRRTATLAGGCR